MCRLVNLCGVSWIESVGVDTVLGWCRTNNSNNNDLLADYKIAEVIGKDVEVAGVGRTRLSIVTNKTSNNYYAYSDINSCGSWNYC